MKNSCITLLVCLSLSACQSFDGEKGQVKTSELVDFEFKNLLNPLFFSETNLFNICFPQWFTEEEVERIGIDSVYLDVFTVSWSDSSIAIEEPDYSFNYVFKQNGQVQKIAFTEYYELTTLVEATFDYSKLKSDSLGYYPPKTEKHVNVKMGTTATKSARSVFDLQRFNRLEFLRQDDEMVIFKNTTAPVGENHIFILNEERQNILFVDDLVTNPDDVFYYGSPTKYTKAFSLINLVSEEVRVKTVFFENTCVPKSNKSQNSGINKNTVFNYNQMGRWEGDKDSLTLNSGEFIQLSETKIVYNELDLPIRVDMFKGSNKNDMRLSRTIKLNYAIKKQKR